MKFDKYDNPKIRTEGVSVGPSGQLPVSHVSGAAPVEAGLREVAQGVMAIKDERSKANIFRARQNELKFAEEADQIDTDFKARNGESGMDTAEAVEKIEALRQKHAAGIQDEAAQADYDTRTRLRVLGMREGLERHATAQREAVYKGIANKALSDMAAAAVKDYNNPEKVEIALRLGLSTAMDYLSGHLGLPDAVVDQTLEVAQAQVYAKVLDTYRAKGQFSAGKAYLETIKDSLGANAPDQEASFRKLTDAAEVEALSTSAWERIQSEATDSVTQRFNPELARAALVELYGPEDRTRIEAAVKDEINTAVAAQNADDAQREGRLSQKISQTGSFSRTDEDYVKLDDVGRARVDAALATAQRIKAHDSAGKNLQKQVNRIALKRFNTLPPSARLAMTDEQIWSIPGIDEEGVVTLQEARAKLAEATKKASLATASSFYGQVNKILPAIKEKYRDHGKTQFTNEVNAWWSKETADGVPPTREDVNKYIGDLLLTLDLPWHAGGDQPKFMLHPDRRGEYQPVSVEEQEYEQAKALIRGDYDKPQAEGAATPAPRLKAGQMSGTEWLKIDPKLATQPGFDPDGVYERGGKGLRRVQ